MVDLAGKVALITGVTAGAGRGIAEAFAAAGARVVGVGRRSELGETVCAGVAAAGGDMSFVRADVGNVDDCRRMVEATIDRCGRLDILVNNAGTVGQTPVAPVHEVDERDYDEVMGVNLKGTFFACRFALPHMLRQAGGTILNIASINAVEAVANTSVYNASKAAVVQLTRTIAVENLQTGIRANAIILGGVESDMNRTMQRAYGRALRGPDWEPAQSWAGQLMTPCEVGRALTALCVDDARLINGATIAIDSGVSAGALASGFVYLFSAGLLPAS